MVWRRGCILAALQLLLIGQAWAQPAIFWFNDPVGPDETVLVTGADLNEVRSAAVARIPDQGPASDPTREMPVDILQANALSLKFVIPKELAGGIYRFTLNHENGSFSARINMPSVYWTQGNIGEAASPAGWIQIFGRNIIRRSDRARLELRRDGANDSTEAPLTSGDLWRGAFRVPDDLAPATYRLRLFNGDGGPDEWTNAGTIVIRTDDPLPMQSLDIRGYGAVGDGRVDCTRAIRTAMNALSQSGGGTLYFPRGRYLISDVLVIPPNVRIRGERTDLVNLVWPDFTNPPPALLQGTSRFSIEDLTIYAS